MLISLPNGKWINPEKVEMVSHNHTLAYNPTSNVYDAPCCNVWLSGGVYVVEGISVDDLAKRVNEYLQR